MGIRFILVSSVALILFIASVNSSVILRDFIQYNIAGVPVLHKPQSWPFDPEVGVRRSRSFQRLNGVHGEKLIERLGLGIDGYEEDRLERQRKRDEGHLDGLNALQP